MAYRVAISELGVVNDSAVIEGPTPGDVWRQVAQHLKDAHKIRIPALEDLGGEGVFAVPRFDNAVVAGQQAPVAAIARWWDDENNRESRTIVTRLLEKLHVGQQGAGGSDIIPPGTPATLP